MTPETISDIESHVTTRELTSVALKILGLSLLVSVLDATLGAGVYSLFLLGIRSTIAQVLTLAIGTAIALGLMVLLSMAVLVRADQLAALIVSSDNILSINVDAPQLERLGLILIGVFFFVTGLQEATAATFILLAKPLMKSIVASADIASEQSTEIVSGVVQIVLGSILIINRDAIVRALSRRQIAHPIEQASVEVTSESGSHIDVPKTG